MSHGRNNARVWATAATIIAVLASLVTILGFFGISHFPGIIGNGSPTPTVPTPVPTSAFVPTSTSAPVLYSSTPDQTLTTFCRDINNNDSTGANEQLTPQYRSFVESSPKSSDGYMRCVYNNLTYAVASNGVPIYFAVILFTHQSGMQNGGYVYLVDYGNEGWKIYDIACNGNVC